MLTATNDFQISQEIVFDILNLFRGIVPEEKITSNLINFLTFRLGFSGIRILEVRDNSYLRTVGHSGNLLAYKLEISELNTLLSREYQDIEECRIYRNLNACSLDSGTEEQVLYPTDVLVVPFLDKRNVEKGYVMVDSETEKKLGRHTMSTLKLACSMAHNAYSNAQINKEISLELSRNRFLYEITNLLNSDFDFEDSVSEIIQLFQSSFGYFWVGFWSFDRKDGLSLLAQAGLVAIDENIIIPRGRDGGVIGIVAANGHFFTVNDLSNSHQNRILGMQGFQSELAVPIIKNEAVFGVLDIRSDKTYAFDQKTRRFSRIVANQLAQAIYTKRSIISRTKELKIRRSIIDVGRIISSILDLETLLKKSLEVLLDTFHYWGAAIFLADELGKNLHFAAQAGEGHSLRKTESIRTGREGIVGLAASTRRITNIPDVNQFPFYIQDINEVRSEIAVPIIKQNRLIGILDVYSRDHDAFDSEDEEILELFANNMSVAITNAKYHKKVQELAIRDGLTGLYNHRHFMEAIERELKISRRFEKPLSLLMMDIDHFKRFNDKYGHPVGDRILKELADTIKTNIRQDIDIPSRYGGEEFTVILIETPAKEAIEISERIRTNFMEKKLEDIDDTLSLSSGIASYPNHSDNCRSLIEMADKALYRAKNSGRNRTILFEKERQAYNQNT